MYVAWIGNCDVTSIGMWRHYVCTPYEDLNYTILDNITQLWKHIGEPREIQIGCYRGDPGQQRRSGSSYDLFWLNKTVRRLRHWNFHLLSFWLTLSLLCDVMLCNYQWEILMITSPLLSNVCHRAMITPVSPPPTTLIHISPSCWTIYRSFEITLEMGTVHWIGLLQWSIQVHCLKKHSVRYELCFKKYLTA